MSEFLFLNSIKMKRSKSLILTSLYHLKFFDMLRRFQKNRVLILMYHRFSNKKEPFKIPQKVFENQIIFLKKRYNFVSLKHYADVLRGIRDNLPPNSIILTIDDGYWDNYEFAYPILKKYSVPATIFLATDFISHKSWLWSNKLEYILKNSQFSEFEFPLNGKSIQFRVDSFKNWHTTQLALFNHCRTVTDEEKNRLLDELAKHLKVDVPEKTLGDFQALTWDQIMEMKNNRIDFGSHSCSHPILSRLSLKKMEHEIVDSKKKIERKLEEEVISFCYPNGRPEDINDSVIEMTQKAGYSAAVSTINGVNDAKNTERFLLKRLSLSTDNKIMLSKKLTRLMYLKKLKQDQQNTEDL